MTTDALQKLHTSLNLLGFYFTAADSHSGQSVQRFSFALLEAALASYHQNADLQQRIARMLAGGDALEKLRAAIFLSAINEEQAAAVLKTLADDTTFVTVQKPDEFGSVNCQVKILAQDFIAEKTIGRNFWKVVNLSDWWLAVSMQKKDAGQIFDSDSLPTWENVLDAKIDRTKRAELLIEVDRLRGGGVAEKFYAAVLLDEIDEIQARQTLETLLDEDGAVSVRYGDVLMNRPARQVAAEMLGLNGETTASGGAKNFVARAFDWLGKTFG